MARQAKGITLPIIYKADMGGLNQATRGLQGFGRIAAQVALAAGAALAGIAIGGIRMASNLETSFAKIQGLVGVSVEEIEVLREAAKRLGPEFGQSANDAANALFFITSAGLRGNDAIEVLEASLKGAAIGLGDVNTIADLATSAVNAYGQANLGGAKAVDVLAEAVRLGKLEPAELAGSMGQVLPIASAMGISFAEVGAAMAAMSRTGTDAASAATQLRGIMTSLLKPTSQAEKALRDVGTSSDEVRKSIRDKGLLLTLQDLTKKFDGNEAAITAVFGNVRALSGVLDLFGENTETTIEILEQMTDEVGVLDEAFGIMEGTVGFKAAKALETLKGVMLEVGDALLPVVSDLLDGLVPALADLSVKAKEFIDTKLVPFINDLRANPDFQEFIENFSETVLELVEPAADLAVNLGRIGRALAPLLKGALKEVNPLLKDFGSILTNVPAILAILAPNLKEGEEAVDGYTKSWVNAIPLIGAWVGPDGIMATLARAVERLREVMEKNEEPIQQFYSDISTGFSSMLDDPINFLDRSMKTIELIFKLGLENVQRKTNQGIANSENEIVRGIPGFVRGGNNIIQGLLRGVLERWPRLASWLQTASQGLPAIIERIRGNMETTGRNIISGLLQGFQTRWDTVRSWLSNVANRIRDPFAGVNLSSIGSNIINGLLNGLKNAWSSVSKWVTDKANEIKNTFASAMKITSPSKVFYEFGENIVDGLVLGMDSRSPGVDASVSNIVPTMPSGGFTSPGGVSSGPTVIINTVTGNPVEIERVVLDAISRANRRGVTRLAV